MSKINLLSDPQDAVKNLSKMLKTIMLFRQKIEEEFGSIGGGHGAGWRTVGTQLMKKWNPEFAKILDDMNGLLPSLNISSI